jgi:hypothetical protein
MTQKAAKKKSKKNSKSGAEASVLGNLRTTRPTRLGGERRATTRARAATRSRAANATKASAGKTATKKRSTTAATQAKATAAHRPAAPPPPPPRPLDGRPKGTEIVTTAVQAAGELAQIGATVGSRFLKRAARRIPRP